MKYIVMDLEWNQGRLADSELQKRIPFEIIEIGAVKLREDRSVEDRFYRIIRPVLYTKLDEITQSLIHMEQQELMNGESFSDVISEFFEWCGSDYRFCTWGDVDLLELQRNMDYHGIDNKLTGVIKFCDIQKLFSLQEEGKKNPHTLEYAVDYYGIERQAEFHRALADAEYTVKVFQKIKPSYVDTFYSLDHYHNPKTQEEEVYAEFKTYSKFISREYNSREEIFRDRKMMQLHCFLCKRPVKKKINWFGTNQKNYYCLGYCKDHGYLKGRIQINKGSENKRYAVKIVSRINKERAKDIKIRHDHVVTLHKK